jgi:hypothetical protein
MADAISGEIAPMQPYTCMRLETPLLCPRTYPTQLIIVGYATIPRIPQSVILWDMTVLSIPHERALTLLFSELECSASEQSEVLPNKST